MQRSQTKKIKETELIIQAAYKSNRKSQFGVMVECLFTN